MNDALIIIPAYNEEETIGGVIKNLKKAGFKDILVVDDGSKDKTAKRAKNENTKVARHIINIGLGGALATGIEYAKKRNCKYVITCDADDQHKVDDVKKILDELKKERFDFIIGSRLKNLKDRPIRYFITLISNFITFILYRKWVSDSGSGLRGFNRKAIETINIKTSGYEVSYELIGIAKREKLRIGEVIVKAIYTNYSLKKGQPLGNAFRIVRKLVVS